MIVIAVNIATGVVELVGLKVARGVMHGLSRLKQKWYYKYQ